MRELLLERERLAMTVADRKSFLSQRLFTESTQVLSAMRAALRAYRLGDDERVERMLLAEVGSEDEEMEAEVADEEMEEEEEEEEAEEDAEVAPA